MIILQLTWFFVSQPKNHCYRSPKSPQTNLQNHHKSQPPRQSTRIFQIFPTKASFSKHISIHTISVKRVSENKSVIIVNSERNNKKMIFFNKQREDQSLIKSLYSPKKILHHDLLRLLISFIIYLQRTFSVLYVCFFSSFLHAHFSQLTFMNVFYLSIKKKSYF